MQTNSSEVAGGFVGMVVYVLSWSVTLPFHFDETFITTSTGFLLHMVGSILTAVASYYAVHRFKKFLEK